MKRYLLPFFLLITYLSFSQVHIRVNYAGYFTNEAKRIILLSEEEIQGTNWTIYDEDKMSILSGAVSSSIASTGGYTPFEFNYEVDFSSLADTGIYTFHLDGYGSEVITISDNPVAFLTSEILQGFKLRRSGTADCLHHQISHVGDTACVVYRRNNNDNGDWAEDAQSKEFNLLGGWYDAGDYIKFTHTIAYSCYLMGQSYTTIPELFDGQFKNSKTDLPVLLDELKYGLDYLLKVHPESGEFVIQTGGHLDHKQWPPRLPENDKLDGERECYTVLSKTQMGLTVAALTKGYLIFKNVTGYGDFADSCLNAAKDIYAEAELSSVDAAYWSKGHETYYGDNTPDDNLALGAIMLFQATNENSYLTDAENYSTDAGLAYWASWGNINMLANGQISKSNSSYASKLNSELSGFNGIGQSNGNIWRVPHGTTWGTLFSYFEVANAAMYSENSSYRHMAIDVLDYTLGLNNWGTEFVATEKIRNSITVPYTTIYKLQNGIFPTGEIAEGPTDAATHDPQKQWFSPAHDDNLWHKEFNAPNLVFYEQAGDYVCMETTIGGLADGLYMFALATKYFGGELKNDCNGDYVGNAVVSECNACVTPVGSFSCDISLSLSEIEDATKLYPNPVVSEVSVPFQGDFYLYNSKGELIKEGSANGRVDVAGKAQGVYLIQNVNTGKVYRFIKQ